MSVRQCIGQIHEWRWWGLEHSDPKSSRLSYIEQKIPDFMGRTEIASERANLVRGICNTRLDKVVGRILRPSAPNASLRVLEADKQKLAHFLEKKDDASFQQLSPEIQESFRRALKIEGATDVHLIHQIQTPMIFLKGETLGEQMLHYYEMLYLIEQQKIVAQESPHLREQKELLDVMQKIKEIEEFDRLTLLFTKIDRHEWRGIVHRASPKVREWLQILETECANKQHLRSDRRYLYQWRGAQSDVDAARFQVYAPHARQVKLLLTAYGKEEHCISMERKGYGVFEVQTHHAFPGRTYRYLVEDCHGQWMTRTDPFGLSVIEKNGLVESIVADRDLFAWNDQNWMQERKRSRPSQKPLSIYEMHVDTWKKKDGRPLHFHELAHQIVHYQKKVPFTHIQLYGLLDNKNDHSWGYQTDSFFAPNRRLGNADDFKFLVDLCHQNKIGVILDWIPAHYKHEHNGDRSQSLHEYDGTDIFGSEHSYWGTMFFDFNKGETRRFLLASALYWLEEMHLDGLRVDAVGPMVHRNGREQPAAIDFLKDLNRVVHERYPGILMIAEDTEGCYKVSKPVYEGGLGFDAKIGVHLQDRTRNYFRTPYRERNWSEHHNEKLLRNLDEREHENWVIAHSHDDSAAGTPNRHSTLYGSIPTVDPWRKFADMRLFHAWNLLTPAFAHSIHMGDEIGQKWPWNERLQSSEGAVEWHLLDHHKEHRALQECVGDLNRLYRSRQAFWKHSARGYRLISHDATNRVIGFHRFDFEGQRIGVFFNFSPMGYKEYDFPLNDDPDLSWIKGAKEIFNTDGKQYGGTGQFPNTWAYIVRDRNGRPTHYRFSFPPLSVLVLEETWT